MHLATNLEELKEEIGAKNHKITSTTNILYTKTKNPLCLFFVELKQKEDNKDTYKINHLLNKIKCFGEPYKKRDILQCTRRQAYGHTKNYWFKSPRYVK